MTVKNKLNLYSLSVEVTRTGFKKKSNCITNKDKKKLNWINIHKNIYQIHNDSRCTCCNLLLMWEGVFQSFHRHTTFRIISPSSSGVLSGFTDEHSIAPIHHHVNQRPQSFLMKFIRKQDEISAFFFKASWATLVGKKEYCLFNKLQYPWYLAVPLHNACVLWLDAFAQWDSGFKLEVILKLKPLFNIVVDRFKKI